MWQRAMALTRACYAIARQLPPEERFALGAQLRRAAISVPANIAEGHASRHRRQFLRYLGIAHASLMEIECHLLIAVDVGHLPEAAISDALSLREETSRMLRAMRRALGESIAER
ncbi:MAG: four helix bundle protein [Gemmatirosa sp.]